MLEGRHEEVEHQPRQVSRELTAASSRVGLTATNGLFCFFEGRRGLYKLSEDKEKNCLVRARPGKGRKTYKHEAAMDHCTNG